MYEQPVDSVEEVGNCAEIDTRMTFVSTHVYEDVDKDEDDYESYQFDGEQKTPELEEKTRSSPPPHSSEVMVVVNDDDDDVGEEDGDGHPRDSGEIAADLQQEEYGTLSEKMAELEEQNAELLAELDELREDFETEKAKRTTFSNQNENLKAELKQTQQALQQHRDALQRLASASETAYQEFEQLKGSYAQEIVCRDKAEKYAATLFAEREAARRQSSMLLMNVAGDRKLMEAMMEVETLTTRVEEQKVLYERQIQELQEEVQSLRDNEGVSSVEEENRQLTEQLNALHAQLTDQHNQYGILLTQYESLEKKLEQATRPPPPPPPPPPPGPSKRLSRLFKGKKSKKEIIKQTSETKGAEVAQGYSQALDEMVKRIKTGAPLKRTVAKPSKTPASPDGGSGGMLELKGMLGNLKKMTVGTGSSPPVVMAEESSELAKAFRKRQKSCNSEPEEAESNDCKQDQKRVPDVPEIRILQDEGNEADTPALKQEQCKPVPRRRTFSKSAPAVTVEEPSD